MNYPPGKEVSPHSLLVHDLIIIIIYNISDKIQVVEKKVQQTYGSSIDTKPSAGP